MRQSGEGQSAGPIRFDLLVRALVRKAGVPPSEVGALTFRQALNILDDSDPSDPHAGGRVLSSPYELYDVFDHLGWSQ